MVRLNVRRPASRGGRYGVKRRMGVSARRGPAKKRVAAKKTGIAFKPSPILVARVKTLMNNLHGYIMTRKRTYGANDRVAMRLQKIHTAFGREIKKANIINAGFIRTLNQLTPALKGVSNVPKTLRNNIAQFKKFLKAHVNQNVKAFLNTMHRSLGQMQTELKKLDARFNSLIKKGKSSKYLCKIDPSLKQRYNTLLNQIVRFKTFWFKHLNFLRVHGKRDIETSVNKIKREFDGLQKVLRKNLTVMNRYSKKSAKKAGWKIQPIYTAGQQKALEIKWGRISKEIDAYRKHAQFFVDQLKSVKLV